MPRPLQGLHPICLELNGNTPVRGTPGNEEDGLFIVLLPVPGIDEGNHQRERITNDYFPSFIPWRTGMAEVQSKIA